MTHVDTPQSACRFGIARGEITPPVGMYHRMWGAARHDRSTGVHRELTATAMAFQAHGQPLSPATGQLLIAVDHCVLLPAEVEELMAAVRHRTELDPAAVVVVCSHTHAAGLLSRDRSALPGGELLPAYLDILNATVAELAAQALMGMCEVTISYATGRCGLAGQRDFWDEASGQWVCGFNPAGSADDTLLAARITRGDGTLLATLVNYACHPTTLAWDNTLVSPDFPGAMREVVERATGVPCVFLQGASGDLGPRDGFVGDTAVADRNGRQLGYAALAALEALPPPATRQCYAGPVTSGATIGTWQHQPLPDERQRAIRCWAVDRRPLPLTYRADLPRRAAVEARRAAQAAEEDAARAAGDTPRASQLRALVERDTRLLARLQCLPEGPAYPLQIVLWRIGDAVWLAVQGEPYQLLQRALRQRFDPSPIVVGVLANDWGPSYLPPADLYGRGVYQESIAVLAAGSLEQLIDELAARIENMLNTVAGNPT